MARDADSLNSVHLSASSAATEERRKNTELQLALAIGQGVLASKRPCTSEIAETRLPCERTIT
jgi:hypothetical protein